MPDYDIFANLKKPRDITQYTLMHGTTDFSQLQQFDLYESGFPFLKVVSVPVFLTKMAAKDEDVANLLTAYMHIIQYEFRGFDSGFENMTSEAPEISNGIQSINVITKTNIQGGSNFSARYFEKSGSTITKLHELYLRSVRDPASSFKHYGGLIGDGTISPEEAGFHQESFSFLYMHTDNTGLLLEKAVYIVGCMPSSAELSIYNGEKGNVEFKEISVEFTGFPIVGSEVNKSAKAILDWMNNESNANMLTRNSYNFKYKGITDSNMGLANPSLLS